MRNSLRANPFTPQTLNKDTNDCFERKMKVPNSLALHFADLHSLRIVATHSFRLRMLSASSIASEAAFSRLIFAICLLNHHSLCCAARLMKTNAGLASRMNLAGSCLSCGEGCAVRDWRSRSGHWSLIYNVHRHYLASLIMNRLLAFKLQTALSRSLIPECDDNTPKTLNCLQVEQMELITRN